MNEPKCPLYETIMNFINKNGVLINLNMTDEYCISVLFRVIYEKNDRKLEELLRMGVDINKVCLGLTPIKYAVHNHYPYGIKMLMNAGADVEEKEMWPILPYAIECGNYDTLTALIEAGLRITYDNYDNALKHIERYIQIYSDHTLCNALLIREKYIKYHTYLQTIVNHQSEDWYPELTNYYPDKFKDIVEAFLVWHNRTDTLPLELVFEIIKQVSKNSSNVY